MSQAPSEPLASTSSPRHEAFRQAVARRSELLRDGMSNSGRERNCCYLNTGGGRFANISATAGIDHIGDGRAYALVDWDHDGDVDVWATNRTAPRVQFLRNNAPTSNHYLAIRLQGNGTTTNVDAIGARLELTTHGDREGKLTKTVRAGEGFLGQSSKTIHFGLGRASVIDELVVHWPGGDTELFADLQVDRFYTIAQGSGEAHLWSRPPGKVDFDVAIARDTSSSEATRIPLRYRVPMPEVSYETVDGKPNTFRPAAGSATLVNLWASWCQPCLRELVELGEQQQQLRAQGLEVLALSVDQLSEDRASNLSAARQFLQQRKIGFEVGFARHKLIGELEATFYYLFDFRRPWAVPTSLLLDRQGRLAVIYVGPVPIETLLADVEQLSLDDRAAIAATLPFSGRWADRVPAPNLTALIATYLDRGFEQTGFRFIEKFADALVADPASAPLFVRLAASLNEAGHVVKSRQRFQQAIEADPQNATAHFEFGKFLVERRAYDEALRNCRKAIQLRPDYGDAHFYLANLLSSQGDEEGALKHFVQTVEQVPDSAKARFALGNAYAGRLQWEAASVQLRRAADLDRENAGYHYQLARVLQKRGLVIEAISRLRRALKLQPELGPAHYALGSALVSRGDIESALEHLRRAHQLQPDSLAVMNGLAWIMATREQTSSVDRNEAVQLARIAAEKTNHNHPQILDTLAAAYAATGQFEEAARIAARAIEKANMANREILAKEIHSRLLQYRLGKPYWEVSPAH